MKHLTPDDLMETLGCRDPRPPEVVTGRCINRQIAEQLERQEPPALDRLLDNLQGEPHLPERIAASQNACHGACDGSDDEQGDRLEAKNRPARWEEDFGA